MEEEIGRGGGDTKREGMGESGSNIPGV